MLTISFYTTPINLMFMNLKKYVAFMRINKPVHKLLFFCGFALFIANKKAQATGSNLSPSNLFHAGKNLNYKDVAVSGRITDENGSRAAPRPVPAAEVPGTRANARSRCRTASACHP